MTQKDRAVIIHNKITEQSPKDMKDIIVQVEWMKELLGDLGYDGETIAFDVEEPCLLKNLRQNPPLFIFNLIEAGKGEESIAYAAGSLFELLGLKYTGCSVESLMTTTNKVLAKIMLKSSGIPTPELVCADDGREFVPECKYIIKPVREDASVGIYQNSVVFIHDLEQLFGLLGKKEKIEGREFFAERYIEGREYDVLLLSDKEGIEALPPLEIVFKGFEENQLEQLYSYHGKWGGAPLEYGNIEMVIAENGASSESLKKTAIECWKLFKLSGYGKVDFRVDSGGRSYVLEVNANPSFYGFYQYEKAGLMTTREAVVRIIDAALNCKRII